MKAFEIKERQPGNFELRGDLTFVTVNSALKSTVAVFRERNNPCFDLAAIERVDSAGLALLIEWLRRTRKSGGVQFTNIPESLMAMARVSGVQNLIPIKPGERVRVYSNKTRDN